MMNQRNRSRKHQCLTTSHQTPSMRETSPYQLVRMLRRRCCLSWLIVVTSLVFLYTSGLYQYVLAQSYDEYYIHWGPTQPLQPLVQQLQAGEDVDVKPVGEFLYSYSHVNAQKCEISDSIRLLYVVKSALQNFEKRTAIRNSWGFENRFSDVEIRKVFLVGMRPNEPHLQKLLDKESEEYKDIIQANFVDSYYNNTIKAMMGLHWAYKYCSKVRYFLFVDDDYYVSTRNMLRFLRDPVNYPQYLEKYIVTAVNEYKEDLLAGYVFDSSHPIRWVFSKWYVGLDEYPYSKWPPYVTAGAYVLSRKSLEDLYYGSIYTRYFRFDDIFLGMAAKKANIKPFHHKEFYFYRKLYDREGFKWVIASHGFDDPKELQEVWNEQRSAGNA